MSRVQQRLDILIAVSDQNLEALKRPQIALKALLNAQAELDRSNGRFKATLASLSSLYQRFSNDVQNAARREYELMNIETKQTRVMDQRLSKIRQALIQSAAMASSQGNLARAEEKLNAALMLSNRGSAEAFAIRQRLQRVQAQSVAASQQAGAATLRQALAEANLARASGNSARELEILTAASKQNNLTNDQRLRVLTAVASAERRASLEAERNARAQQRQSDAGGGGGILGSTLGAVGKVYNTITRTLASVVLIGFTIRTVFRTLDRFAIEPMKNLFMEVVNTTDQFRQMELTISGITGSLRDAKAVTRDIGMASQGLPITQLQAMHSVRGLAYTPAIANMLSNDNGRVDKIKNILSILTSLATINPEQGTEGAQFAVREALAGQFRSLRFRFNVSPDVIAQSIGKNLADLKADPSLVLPALKAFTDSFVGPDTIAQFTNLMSKQGELLHGSLEQFLNMVGNSGIYDHTVGILKSANTGFQRELTGNNGGPTPRMAAAAMAVSNALDHLLGVVLSAASGIVKAFTGVEINFAKLGEGDQMIKFIQALTVAVEGVASFAAKIVIAGEYMGEFMAKVGKALGIDFSLPKSGDIRNQIADLESKISSADTGFPMEPWQRARALERARDTGRRILNEAQLSDPGLESGSTQYDNNPELMRIREAYTASMEHQLAEINRLEKPGVLEVPDMRAKLEGLQRLLHMLDGLEKLNPAAVPDPQGVQEFIDNAGKATQGFTFFIKEYTQGLESIQSDKESLITTQFAELHGKIKSISDPETGFGKYLTMFNTLIDDGTARIDELSRQLDANQIDDVTFIEKDKRLIDAIKRLTDVRKNLLNQFTVGTSDAIQDLIKSVGPSLQDMPREFRAQQIMSLMQSLAALRGSGNLGAVTSGTATSAQAAYAAMQGRLPAQFQGGAMDLTQILAALPAGSTVNAAPGALDYKTLSQTLHEVMNDWEGMPKELEPLRDQLKGTLGDLLSFYKQQHDDAKQRLESAMSGGPGSVPQATADLNNADLMISMLGKDMWDLAHMADQTAMQIKEIFQNMGQEVGQTIKSGLIDTMIDLFKTGGESVGKIVGNMVEGISRAVLDAVFEMMLVRSLINPAINSAFGLTGSSMLPTTNLFGGGAHAAGNAFMNGRIVPFATGGVIGGPSMFAMGSGRWGIAGEEAPEAILPLGRGADGRLGVMSQGGGRSVSIQQHFHFHHGDPDKFRRSSRQLMTDAKRAAETAWSRQ